MAVLASIATGNWTAAATWGVVDATSYLNGESATESLLTTAYSGTRSSAFTPGAITVSHLGVKLCERIGTTGTMSVSLRNSTIGLDDFVTGTEVTIDVADLPSALEADLNGGWIFFKLSAAVLLLAATDYNIQAKTSSTTQVDLFTNGTTDNISRCLVTTTTQTPVATDDLIVAGEKTGQGTSNAFVVTMNETATTDYGAASTSLVTPAIAICNQGTLRNGIAAATAYNLKVSGNIIIYSGGEFDLGTVATAMPRDSSVTLLMDCAANVDFGITVRNLGTFIAQGLSRTAAKLITRCLLNTDEAANSTSLGVDTDTGWLDNDEIAVASTTRTASQSENGTLNGAAGAATLTVDGFTGAAGGVLNAHSGTSPTQAEVILLTRNVRVIGVSATLQTYLDIKATATVDCDWVEFKFLGSATALKQGIETLCTTGVQSFRFCALHQFVVTGSCGIRATGASGTGLTFSDNVTFNIANSHFLITATSGSSVVSDNVFMKNITAALDLVFLQDLGGTFQNNTVVSAIRAGIICNEAVGATFGTWSGNTAHSNGTSGVNISLAYTGTVGSLKSWRNTTSGIVVNGGDIDFGTSCELFGNVTQNISVVLGCGRYKFSGAVISADTSFATTNGILCAAGAGGVFVFDTCTFGVVAGIKAAHTNDINLSTTSFVDMRMNKCILASATEISTQAGMTPNSVIRSQQHDQTAGSHKTFFPTGTAAIDTVIFDTTPSLRITPTSATVKCAMTVGTVNLNSGQTATPSIKVRESVVGDGTDYNGNRIRLLVRRNDAMGITADTVLATATVSSVGAFETISAATAAASEDGVLEFAVDCDGTTGWINADTLTVSVA